MWFPSLDLLTTMEVTTIPDGNQPDRLYRKIVRSFLKYQLTAYPFADARLHAQMRKLLSLDTVRRTPLLQGPHVSLSRGFRQGDSIDTLIAEGSRASC